MKFIAVIVTYNRFELLKECIQAIRDQTSKVDEILVVNNNSTDGTTEWLNTQTDITLITQENQGGSWGFYTGLKAGYLKGYDWIWVMDDDTIPDPDAFEKLKAQSAFLSNQPGIDTGFIGSKAIWKDSRPHYMNLPSVHTFYPKGFAFNTFDAEGLISIQSTSFVSLLINRAAIKAVGLPFKEFFIWADDAEYTYRITRAGFYGFYSSTSVVNHKTPVNYMADIYTDSIKNLWKYRYGIRNELFLFKHFYGNKKFLSKLLKRLFVIPFRIYRQREGDKWTFIKANFLASVESITFSPRVEKV
ncbi:glycosyltransferase family 2 protein [Pedobacter sp. SYSU D00535]|uniref:glycosyltransferase family 2 protein n=1 Tax=Pedobacter sp. SYSU D00535 TaxID=2810308 RepID=UPI001A95BCE7|nr:glycosyltransferase family 2 protein [Pedobacter sp. SYSU D00535]